MDGEDEDKNNEERSRRRRRGKLHKSDDKNVNARSQKGRLVQEGNVKAKDSGNIGKG